MRITDKEKEYVSSAVKEEQGQEVTPRKWETPKKCLTCAVSLRSDVYSVFHDNSDYDEIFIQWRSRNKSPTKLNLGGPAGMINW